MSSDQPREHLTEDLLKRLLASSSIESYLDENETLDLTLPDFLRELLDREGINRSELSRRSGLNSTVVYDIFEGKSRPGRDHAIMLALGLGCNLYETQRLLRLAGASELWCKKRRDAVIIWCIEQGMDRASTDDELYRLGEKTLLGTGKLR
jgi:transcriptional regulator with XRE-family HTH domain